MENENRMPAIEEVAYHASVNPHLDFYFSNGRLHVEKNPKVRMEAV